MVHLPQTVIGDLLIWTGTIPRRVTTMMTMIWQIWLFANPFKPRDLGETQLLGKKKKYPRLFPKQGYYYFAGGTVLGALVIRMRKSEFPLQQNCSRSTAGYLADIRSQFERFSNLQLRILPRVVEEHPI